MKLGYRIGIQMLHRCGSSQMAIQEVRRKATSIEVSFGQSELSTDIADDGAKIGRVDSQFAAVQ